MANTPEQSLAIRILNFVMPYIPEHIKEEALEIIKNETSKPSMEERKPMTAKELRDYLESMPCPFCTDKVTDGELERISESLETEMKPILDWEKDGTISHDKAADYETEILERLCSYYDIPYYEDL